MNTLALKAEKLGKLYRLGQTAGYKTLRESITNVIASPFRRASNRSRVGYTLEETVSPSLKSKRDDYIWALKDVSFEVKRGEALAIIGSNGAGKSTLLKILSRITAPTTGYAEIYGRVVSLLEIGTGFHPELTGKENIFFNGSVLGMKRYEIERVFDQIVDFAGLENFLDTPVKRYSSGMYVRLGFAIAAHLEPDILIVDEVLAVGDAAFQKKCLGKMNDVTGKGRTILFVSHNMSAVRALCSRAILINHGQVEMDGTTSEVIRHYLGEDRNTSSGVVWPDTQRPGNRSFKLNSVTLKAPDGSPCASIEISKGGYFEIEFEAIEDRAQANFSLALSDTEGNILFNSVNNIEPNFYGKPLSMGRYISTCRLPGDILEPGAYSISIVCAGAQWSDYFRVDGILSFTAIDDGVLSRDYHGTYLGVFRPRLEWTTRRWEE
jgi:lipopolysaccharide transport system ATP-binding protein